MGYRGQDPMNPENRGYYLRNRLAEPHKENRGTVQNREELLTVEQPLATPLQPAEPQHLPTPPPTVEPVDPSISTMMMQPTGIHLEKFAGDDSVDAKSWLNWFERYCLFHKQDEGQQLLTLPFYLTSHARIWYDALPDAAKTDLKTLKEAFESRFRKQDILDTELLDITQRPEESCNDYFTRVLKKAQQSTADKSLVSSLAIKGLRPAIKQIVMPQNPKDFDDARQRAILAEKTVLATTAPVAAYSASASDNKVEELTKMVKDLKFQLDHQQANLQSQQPQFQQQNSTQRGDRKGPWRGRHRQQNRDWRNPPAWQQPPRWDQQSTAQYWQQQGPKQDQRGTRQDERSYQRPQKNCTGCKGEDLNCNFPDYCSSFRSFCNKCRQKGHYVSACPSNR